MKKEAKEIQCLLAKMTQNMDQLLEQWQEFKKEIIQENQNQKLAGLEEDQDVRYRDLVMYYNNHHLVVVSPSLPSPTTLHRSLSLKTGNLELFRPTISVHPFLQPSTTLLTTPILTTEDS